MNLCELPIVKTRQLPYHFLRRFYKSRRNILMTQLTALKIQTKLATTPTKKPLYAVEVQNNKNESVTLADPRATRALLALMNQHAVIGGAACHWGGPAAFAEMMSALHGIMFAKKNYNGEWYDHFHFVNDAGHAENGIYALRALYNFDGLNFSDLRKFRSIESKLTGHGEAHLNPEGVLISNGPLGSGVPQAQGLAIADKLLGNARITCCVLSDGGAMEGEAKEALAAIPGLAKKNKLNPFLLLISDNNTKLGGRIDEDSYSMNPSFEAMTSLGWDVRVVKNGNDLQTCYTEIEKALSDVKNNSTKPVALILKTIKGFGVKSTMENASGGHGYPLGAYDEKLTAFVQEIYNGSAPAEFTDWASEILKSKPAPKPTDPNAVKTEKVQDGFARALIKMTKAGYPIFSLSSDLQSSTGVKAFHKDFPGNYIDLGIAESNMVSSAIGLSKAGLIPIVDTFAQFGITKGNLPFIMAGLSQGPVIAMFSHTGFQDAADGASHQATTYFAALASIPHVTLVNVSCSDEAETLMEKAIIYFKETLESGNTPNSIVFFLGRENHPSSYVPGTKYDWMKAQVLRSGSAATLVTAGPLVQKALKAADELKARGIDVSVINHPFINHTDMSALKSELAKTGGKLITIEDHQVKGGLGALLTHDLAQDGVTFKVKSLGIQGEFGQSAYKADELYARHGIDHKGIISSVESFLK